MTDNNVLNTKEIQRTSFLTTVIGEPVLIDNEKGYCHLKYGDSGKAEASFKLRHVIKRKVNEKWQEQPVLIYGTVYNGSAEALNAEIRKKCLVLATGSVREIKQYGDIMCIFLTVYSAGVLRADVIAEETVAKPVAPAAPETPPDF